MKAILSLTIWVLLPSAVISQESITYQKPPKEILELVDLPLPPSVRIDDKGENMILLYRDNYKTIAQLSKEELRLGGLRIDPKTNISSRITYYNNIKVQSTREGEAKQVSNLPDNPLLANFKWSPDQAHYAFTHTSEEGVTLWVMDLKTAKATKLSDAKLNANLWSPYSWFRDGQSLLVKMLPKNRQPLIKTSEAIPMGPTVSSSDGEKAQNRTYQDLLKNTDDENNFVQLVNCELYKVVLDGSKVQWAPLAMYRGISHSSDGNYILVTSIQKPFSYLVPHYRFPQDVVIHDKSGAVVKLIVKVPLTDVMPKGFMAVRTGKRSLRWRADRPATLFWAEALDEGDPAKDVEFRDEVFQLEAPFDAVPTSLLKTINRYSRISWGNDSIAIVYDRWWNTRNSKTYVFNPADPSIEPNVIFDRNYQDRYSDPGSFVKKRNKYNRGVLDLDKGHAFLIGDGYTDKGQFPFIDKFDLENGEKKRLYLSSYTDKEENIYEAIDSRKGTYLVRIESPSEYPNYYIRNIKDDKLTQITAFENPFKSINNVHKEVIKYKRDDGLKLSGTLYLPVGYDQKKKERLPMILWAYPREFKDKKSASQTTSNPNGFIYPYYGSMVYWLTRGYVLLDRASFPIVGVGDEEPNDSFRKQLVANGKAAIDAVYQLGYIDKNRVAVGGHSYGAFMTANLLSHSDLFAAGIARSGAYNRTLTPFGFQSEERSYWEAPDVYNTMSPFMHADKMKTPLLLIHGNADNNSGTYPLQSERYFNALKGLGATARLVMLPKESHGYRAKESILHLLWEQDQWLEKYVKNRPDIGSSTTESK